jgi:hypothetical protein
MANLKREQVDMNDATADPGSEPFAHRSESLGRALADLLSGAPDATPQEQATHVRKVTERLTEDWQTHDRPPRVEICVDCEQPTREPTLVRCVEVGSGPGGMLYACPDCAPRYAA